MITEKRSHFGMAGHFAAMSELLLRGYNVAVPSVDVGDDVLVLDDQRGSLRRVQVKTADVGEEVRDEHARLTRKVVKYTLSRQQLREQKASDLFFMLMVRWNRRWRFLFVPRQKLADMRDDFVARPYEHARPEAEVGRPGGGRHAVAGGHLDRRRRGGVGGLAPRLPGDLDRSA